MAEVFLNLANMSMSAGWIVAAVLLVRLVFRKMPKWLNCVLWGIVALRLLVPVVLETPFSLMPSPEVLPPDITQSQTPAIHSGVPVVNQIVNPLFVIEPDGTVQTLLSVASVIWAVGAGAMLLYGAISYLLLKRRVQISILQEKNIYLCDGIESPFVFGVFRPRIYLPSDMDMEQLEYVLCHEKAHIQRRDHWWKPIGFVLLTVYWFNPLLWLGYLLLCRDIEQACDEKVIAGMDSDKKKFYSQALVACSVHRKQILACPVAFGEVGVKARVKNIAYYKKPAFWMVIGSIVVCAVVAVCFLTNPMPCQHNYEAKQVKAPTCTQEGIETRTCSLCQHSYSTPVAMLAHTYDDGRVLAAPTCVATGTKELSCTACGTKTTQVMEMTPHIDSALTVTKEPNCVETGEKSATCSYCQAVYVVEILETNDAHDFQETVLKESTCTKNGEGIKTCIRCNHSESVSYELKEHNFKYYRSDSATCSYMGEEIYVCTDCNAVDIKKIPINGEHEWSGGLVGSYCRYCGKYKSTNSNRSSDYSLFDGVGGDKPSVPELPVVKWDISEDMRPKP